MIAQPTHPGGGKQKYFDALSDELPVWMLVGTLAALLSPLSQDGRTLLSSTVSWTLLFTTAAVTFLARRQKFAPGPTISRRMACMASAFAILIATYALFGAAAGYSPRLVVWDMQPFVEFAAYFFTALVVLDRPGRVRAFATALVLASAAKAVWDLSLFVKSVKLEHLTTFSIESHRIVDAVPFLLGPLALFLGFHEGFSRSRRVLFLSCAAVIFVVMLLSFTRSYWAGYVLGLAVAAAVVRGGLGLRVASTLAGSAVLFVVIAVALPHTFVGRDARLMVDRARYTELQIDNKSANPLSRRRQVETERAWRQVVDSRFQGQGLGATIYIDRKYILRLRDSTQVPNLHNFFLQILWKLGLVGIVLMVTVMVWSTRQAARIGVRSVDVGRALGAGVVALWVMESVQMLFYSTPNIFHVPAFLAVFTAATLGMTGQSGESTRSSADRSFGADKSLRSD